MSTENNTDGFDTSGTADDAAAEAIISQAIKDGRVTVAAPKGEQTAAEAALAQQAAARAQAAAAEAAKQQAVEAARLAAEEQLKNETVRYEYNPTGDPGLDLALAFVGNLGFSAESSAIQAATKGDFGPMKAALEVLGDKAKGHEKYLALAEAAFTSRNKAAQERSAKDEAAVYSVVGGKEQWDAIAAHARANADEGEKAAISAAMAAGGLQAQSMALLLQQAYQRANPRTPAVIKQEASGSRGGNSQGPMTAQEYAAEVRKIAVATRGPIDSNPKYLALREQYARQ